MDAFRKLVFTAVVAGLLTGGDYISGINPTTIIVAAIGAVIVVVGWNMLRGRTRTGSGPI